MSRLSIKDIYTIESIKKHETYEWLLHKHYLKRLPSISYCFGLFNAFKNLCGVITFGMSANFHYNDGDCVFNNYKVYTLELNRLCVNDNLKKNVLSYFVSQSLKKLPKPTCIVSFADANKSHHGYIYQATNWIYTGRSSGKFRYTFDDGTTFDMNRFNESKGKVVKKEKMKRTYRYLFFHGTKKQKKKMLNSLKMKIQDYPKGANKRYNADYKPKIQTKLF
tara:strand:+ start:49 stop:711 length:663 start_codon:yes stop_codon:yes gene_type:complete